ncbi:hypothetical protein OS122_02760 [Mycolicibacterium mucogenicum]|uniref:helix-turn-helix transcriptional regulator n=1 Tax=Mycolicibacterium mucogenicum TaxID=56689 RepID=UPI00226982B9|nr:hypothetical protein [Mycolicibacterium mucogenicum]MCX8559820.1 hypothetical protein [Mycolicibacterium mucogenicum]
MAPPDAIVQSSAFLAAVEGSTLSEAEKASVAVETEGVEVTKLLTVDEVADLIAPDGVNKHMWTWRRMADGRIPGAIRIDRTHLVIPEAKFHAWLAANTVEPVRQEPVSVTESAVIQGISDRVASRRMARSA